MVIEFTDAMNFYFIIKFLFSFLFSRISYLIPDSIGGFRQTDSSHILMENSQVTKVTFLAS